MTGVTAFLTTRTKGSQFMELPSPILPVIEEGAVTLAGKLELLRSL